MEGGGFGKLLNRFVGVGTEDGTASVELWTLDGADVGGRPSAGLEAGAARESG